MIWTGKNFKIPKVTKKRSAHDKKEKKLQSTEEKYQQFTQAVLYISKSAARWMDSWIRRQLDGQMDGMMDKWLD